MDVVAPKKMYDGDFPVAFALVQLLVASKALGNQMEAKIERYQTMTNTPKHNHVQ